MLPFTSEQFLAVFGNYNSAIWPVQIAAYLLGGVVAALLFLKTREADRIIAGILASMWLWTGIGYHGLWFSAINQAAYLFAALFVVQGCYIFYSGFSHQIHFGPRPDMASWAGMAFIAYAAIVYPLIGVATGRSYPHMPMFGITPCPVTIFTFGLFLLTTSPVPRWLLVVPFVWSLIGGSAAILLNVPQDWFLLASGFIAAPLIVFRDRLAIRAAGNPSSA
ncbi:hypothetical protein LMTR13_05635 [Bradyrhizobium icense]|uniref:Uncharacterized protein n=1 Tax=Bradyrhizobium icense TaxID=1274631 RepID=A0A1B1UR99_9BRAD|nr:hypothetical protein LMTR13_05635 [Bradyrhizobium icense]